jgi:hypothetical protein
VNHVRKNSALKSTLVVLLNPDFEGIPCSFGITTRFATHDFTTSSRAANIASRQRAGANFNDASIFSMTNRKSTRFVFRNSDFPKISLINRL